MTFSLNYYVKIRVPFSTIFNRCFRLAHQALAIHATLCGTNSLKEDLVTDGLKSFVYSQYFPNNIHLLAGSLSQYLYAIDYAHLRRKGRMTEAQKARRAELDQLWFTGKRSIRRSFGEIVDAIEELVAMYARHEGRRGIPNLWTGKVDFLPGCLFN